jgi:hypothetical protein
MASPFLWPVLVPYALRAPAPVNLGVRPMRNTPHAQAERAAFSAAAISRACASWFAQGLVACLRSNGPSARQSTHRGLMHMLPLTGHQPNWALHTDAHALHGRR